MRLDWLARAATSPACEGLPRWRAVAARHLAAVQALEVILGRAQDRRGQKQHRREIYAEAVDYLEREFIGPEEVNPAKIVVEDCPHPEVPQEAIQAVIAEMQGVIEQLEEEIDELREAKVS